MKKRLMACLTAVCCLCACFVCPSAAAGGKAPSALGSLIDTVEGSAGEVNFTFSSEAEMLAAMKPVCENGSLGLYYDPATLAVAVKNKKSGAIFTSNPYGASRDPGYAGDVAKTMDSQLVFSYLEENNKKLNLWSGADSVEKGQYTVSVYENGLEFALSVGEEVSKTAAPVIFTEKRFKELTAKLSEDDREDFEYCYDFYTAEEAKDEDIAEVFPGIKMQAFYYCSTEMNDREKRDINQALEGIGYTYDDYCADLKALGTEAVSTSVPHFTATLRYLLTENGLSVTVPRESLTWEKDYPLVELTLLPYFGADLPNGSGKGYLFLPDGSGTVIAMDGQDANRRSVISGKVYGDDASRMPSEGIGNDSRQYYLPVFGVVRNNDSALFAVITDGEENAEISACLGEPNGRYYGVRTKFMLTNYEYYTRQPKIVRQNSASNMYMYDENWTDADCGIDYCFLNGQDADYSGMARIYRELLMKDGASVQKTKNAGLHVETVGTALAERTLFGFSYDAEIPFTTFAQDEKLIDALREDGVTDLSVMLLGWQKRGLDAAVSDKVRVSRALGGASGLRKLISYCKENKIRLGAENELSVVTADLPFDGFSKGKNATRTMQQKYAAYGMINPATQKYMENGYVVSSRMFDKYMSGLMKGTKRFAWDETALGMLGTYLNADYQREKEINRTEAKQKIVSVLGKKAGNRSFDGANAYILPYASALNAVPLTDSDYLGETASVPFVQLAVSGCAECRSEPLNLGGNLRRQLLYCLQSNTVPTFVTAYGNISYFKKTDYTKYYSISFDILKKNMKESYDYLAPAREAIGGSRLVRHELVTNDVVKATFENGTAVYVNFSGKAYSSGAVKVGAEDYFIEGGKAE